MPGRRPQSNQPDPSPIERSLLERVRGRVGNVTHQLKRRDNGSIPASTQEAREVRALFVVYRTLGRTHRRYRERTGEHVPPNLKAAARAFKREPSVVSLAPVAGFLDELRLLKW